nr:MAG: hypothetical protein DIU68_16180 [Chloroflexota bacterium]
MMHEYTMLLMESARRKEVARHMRMAQLRREIRAAKPQRPSLLNMIKAALRLRRPAGAAHPAAEMPPQPGRNTQQCPGLHGVVVPSVARQSQREQLG